MAFIDRSKFMASLNRWLTIEPQRTAVVAVDMHRGHLDPEVATMPLAEEDCRSVIANTTRLFEMARKAGIPIIHVVMVVRKYPAPGEECLANPFWNAIEEMKETLTPGRTSTVRGHNIEGSVQAEVVPALGLLEGDYLINNKKRLSIFYGTDLEILLRTLKVDTLLLVGVNTNTCVQCAAFEAHSRDYRAVVISDCVASQHGSDLHEFALQNIARCMGWVLTLKDLEEKLQKYLR